MSFCYRAYGLTLDSELTVPFLPPGFGTADVRIRLGKVPERLEAAALSESWFSATPSQLLLPVPGVARFYVRDGCEIVVDLADGPPSAQLPSYLLGSAMGGVILQRGLFPLHASAVEIGGQAVLFAGDPGAGKSTLAAAFARRGFSVLADDICVVGDRDHDGHCLTVGPPFTKLSSESLAAFDVSAKGLEQVDAEQGAGKFVLPRPLPESEQVPVRGIYILGSEQKSGAMVSELPPAQRVAALVAMTYRYSFLVSSEQLERHLEQCGSLVRAVPVQRLNRFQGSDVELSTTALVDQILADLAERGARAGGELAGR